MLKNYSLVDFVAPSLEEDDKLDGSEVYIVSSECFVCRDLCVRRWEVLLSSCLCYWYDLKSMSCLLGSNLSDEQFVSLAEWSKRNRK